MRGRQLVYPTIGRAPNRPARLPVSRWDMLIFKAREWAEWDHAHPLQRPRGMSPRVGWSAPPRWVGRLNWAMLESSGILVSAFDSEATGEFA